MDYFFHDQVGSTRALVNGQNAIQVEGEAVVGLYAHAQPARLSVPGMAIEVPPYHLAWCHRTWQAQGKVSGAGALWFEVRP